MTKKKIRQRPGRASGMLALLFLCVAAAPLHAQMQTVETSQSSVHFLAGGFVGRFDLDGAGRTDLFGGRAGVGYGELLQLTGFYWQGFDRSADSITADRAWGGELQFNLNAGFGVTPFVTGGIARVRMGDTADQTAALAGVGLTLPLWRVLVHVAARDYMFGVTGLENDDSPDGVTHNWLYSAGFKLALGQRRSAPVVVAAPDDDRAIQSARAELAALRDSVRLANVEPGSSAVARVDSTAAPRNYQSTDRIEVPIPTEGSITLRYGPERAADTAPVVVAIPGTASPFGAAAADAGAMPPPTLPGATLDDPATRAWLEQQVAAQVAQQLSRMPPATSAALTPKQLDALAQRVLDGVLTTVVPRLEAAQTRGIDDLRDDLREDLRAALQQQRVAGQAYVAAVPTQPVVQPDPAQPLEANPPPTPPADIPGPVMVERASPAPAAEDRALAAVRAEAALRTMIAAVVADHPAYFMSRETGRGPAAVIGEAAFESGAALVRSGARRAIGELAEMLRSEPDRFVYIQGHTDAVGEELENQRLSELRAEAIRSLLVQEGVAGDRLFAIGYGEAQPVADNVSAKGRAQNRRVEVVVGERIVSAGR